MLRDVAFGPDPGRYPLPTDENCVGRWHRAVALGGQGRYAQARAELAVLRRPGVRPAVAALAASTQASLLRQLGFHAHASGYDGAALALAGASGDGPAADPLLHEARCDAFTGLAADALGCGRLPLGHRMLQRCRQYLDDVDTPDTLWRQYIRLHWVSAEIALAAGDFETATVHARDAVARAADAPSVRHRVKSALLSAAAATGQATPDVAHETARQVLDDCGEHGLLPLRWAAAMLLDGVRPDPSARAIRDDCAAEIARRGGRFTK
ncbi:hypothetical protein [Prescottella subtropica]|uniref:hypothetical protein n=1 Tax=Prescottella subtropica TaxID=2545757 RepID=UPI0010F45F8F|nr:hypothetical protein [Prescottella subtropica]